MSILLTMVMSELEAPAVAEDVHFVLHQVLCDKNVFLNKSKAKLNLKCSGFGIRFLFAPLLPCFQ